MDNWILDWSIVTRLGLKEQDGRLLGNGTNAEFDCPRCGKSKKFHICIAKNHERFRWYQCLSASCDLRGRVRVGRGKAIDLSYLRQAEEEYKRNLKLSIEVEHNELAKQKEVGLELPDGFTPVQRNMLAWRYLTSRGITPADIRWYGLGVAEGRIVFPEYDESGRLTYYVEREYADPERAPKYRNVQIADGGAQRRQTIFNLGRFKAAGYTRAHIVEGPITGIVASRRHLALLGKPSREQVDLLRSLKLEAVYLALDPDARATCVDLALALWGSVGKIWIVPVPAGHDCASMGRAAYRELVRDGKMLYDKNKHIALQTHFLLDGPRQKPRPKASFSRRVA